MCILELHRSVWLNFPLKTTFEVFKPTSSFDTYLYTVPVFVYRAFIAIIFINFVSFLSFFVVASSAWSEDGCHIDQTNRTHTICMCNHLTNFAILMDVIDDTAQFIEQVGLFDENMRILISISIAISIVFIVIALLTLKFFNGIFIKVRTTQSSGQDALNSLSSCNNQLNTNNRFENNQRQCYNGGDNTGGIDEMPTCQSNAHTYSAAQMSQNILQMPNNDCTISTVNNLSERIPLQNYQHFHHHYHHHHHIHLQQPANNSHDNSHNHFVFNSNVFNANTTNLGDAHNCLKQTNTDDQRNNGSTDDRNLIVNLPRKNDATKNDIAMDRVTTAYGTTTDENFPMARINNENNFIRRGHLQGHLHSHYSRYSQQMV